VAVDGVDAGDRRSQKPRREAEKRLRITGGFEDPTRRGNLGTIGVRMQ
jgi:hypothetical protein